MKKLRKEVMRRPRQRNKYYKNCTCENWSNYKKNLTFTPKILKKTKTDYCSNIDIKHIVDNKMFWILQKDFRQIYQKHATTQC